MAIQIVESIPSDDAKLTDVKASMAKSLLESLKRVPNSAIKVDYDLK